MTFQTGTCNYKVVWKAYFHVPGNELLGQQQVLGEYESKIDAELAFVEDGFSRTEPGSRNWKGRNGYARGYINPVIEYDFNIEDLL